VARSIVPEPGEVVVGVDTHADIHVAVVLSSVGARLGSTEGPRPPVASASS